jgi:hypothetical protein
MITQSGDSGSLINWGHQMVRLIIIAFALLASGLAQAQTSTFYGPTGQYQGQATTTGNTTTYYGSTGQYQGQSTTMGNTTTLYGPTGQYQGQVTSPQPQPSFGPGRRY